VCGDVVAVQLLAVERSLVAIDFERLGRRCGWGCAVRAFNYVCELTICV